MAKTKKKSPAKKAKNEKKVEVLEVKEEVEVVEVELTARQKAVLIKAATK